MRALSLAALVVLAACSGSSTSSGSNGPGAAQSPAALRETGTMHVALTSPNATSFDVPAATCVSSARGEAGGGLHVSAATAPGAVSASIDGNRVGADGADDWTAPPNGTTLDAPLLVHVTLADGAIFSGGAGSSVKLTSSGGGSSGTVSFSGATYAGKSGVSDAAGTISWTCTAS